jgi:hypothetical protein
MAAHRLFGMVMLIRPRAGYGRSIWGAMSWHPLTADFPMRLRRLSTARQQRPFATGEELETLLFLEPQNVNATPANDNMSWRRRVSRWAPAAQAHASGGLAQGM